MSLQSDKRNYYDLLHVSRNAPVEIIRGSYRTLMQQLKHHPDLGGDTSLAAQINEAYAVLSDARRRAEYDSRLDLMARIAEGAHAAPSQRPAAADNAIDLAQQCAFCEAPHNLGKDVDGEALCAACGSPLAAARNRRIESGGQRAVERIGKRHKISFFTEWPQASGCIAHIEDMSLNGLRMVTTEDLVAGQRIKIVSDVLAAVARVTHCQYERRGWSKRCVAGVAFITLRFSSPVGGFVSDRV